MEAALTRRADIHTGAFADGGEPFEDGDGTGVVIACLNRHETPF